MPDRTVAPPFVDAVNFNLQLQPYQKYTLKNGVKVYAIDAGTEDVLQIEWVFDAGNWQEEKNLQAAVTNHLLKNGTGSKSAYEINEYFDYYGAYLNRNCYAETATISLHCLTKHIKELLPAVKEIIAGSTMPQKEMEIAVQNMKQKLDVNLKKSSFVAGRLIDVYLFGEMHPYGRFSRHEDFDRLTREDLLSFYETYYRNGSLKIFIAGRLPEHIDQLLDACFGDLPNAAVKNRNFSIDPAAQKKYEVINDDKNNQGSIRIARPFFNRHHPDFLKCQVLNVVFGGYFGSRLMANVREEKGYTYGIHSYLLNNRYDNGWMISTEAGREVSAAAIAEVYREMAILREEPVDAEELLLVKNFMMGSILGDLDGPFHIIGRWKNIVLNDLDNAFFERSIQNIKTITAADLQEMANKYLHPEAFYELTVV
ncbi:M16 family metallopeptidase [Niabella drilacis]|uniref:Predicted Zn-dependent peptidase n=1 Tax=Niabella drilacis (strain DSM 25811 / CCM 8410 / CCUG 62505 / LMG 26954 / E90) TaxID=1285928 RepID=A0A1G7B4I8_NIADE|nr:pitrilysin family protein [Niabella drilacis]SDE22009.1 Predicted Zn-dependent peptidase [Niabella drilacis]